MKPIDMNPNFTNKVILSASRTSNCVVIRTWDIKHRWSKTLYLSANALDRWLHGDHTLMLGAEKVHIESGAILLDMLAARINQALEQSA